MSIVLTSNEDSSNKRWQAHTHLKCSHISWCFWCLEVLWVFFLYMHVLTSHFLSLWVSRFCWLKDYVSFCLSLNILWDANARPLTFLGVNLSPLYLVFKKWDILIEVIFFRSIHFWLHFIGDSSNATVVYTTSTSWRLWLCSLYGIFFPGKIQFEAVKTPATLV